jgi:hypothetical protein
VYLFGSIKRLGEANDVGVRVGVGVRFINPHGRFINPHGRFINPYGRFINPWVSHLGKDML